MSPHFKVGQRVIYWHPLLDERFPAEIAAVNKRGLTIELPSNDGIVIKRGGKGVIRRSMTLRQAALYLTDATDRES